MPSGKLAAAIRYGLRWSRTKSAPKQASQRLSLTPADVQSVRFRAECLNAHLFQTLADAAEKLEAWRIDYNEVRPHGAIGNKPPIALMNPGDTASLSP